MTTIMIDAPRFCAGAVYDEDQDKVVRCAPILRRDLMGMSMKEVTAWCMRKGYYMQLVPKGQGSRPIHQ